MAVTGDCPFDLVLTPSAVDQVLENNMLFRNILENIEDSYDLGKARRICSKWKRLATEILRERNWIARKFLTFSVEDMIKDYLTTFSQSQENIMFTCFKIEPAERSHAYAFWLDKFLQAFPNSMKSLDLNMTFNSPVQFESILQLQANSLIELKIIRDGLSVFQFDMDFTARALPVDFYLNSLQYFCTQSEYVTRTNSLHKLNLLECILKRIPPENKNTFKLYIGESDQIRNTVVLLQKYDLVKSLKMQSIVNASTGELNLLINSGVKLDYLVTDDNITYKDATGDNEEEEALWVQDMYDYLSYQRKTLKMLEWTSKVFKFPPWGMSEITKLKLKYINPRTEDEDEDSDDEDEVPAALLQGHNLNPNQIIIYSDLFPSLEDLRIVSAPHHHYRENSQNHPDFESMFLAPQLPFTTLQKLQVHYDGITTQMLNAFSTMFPRIKSFDIGHYEGLSDEEQWDFYSALWNAQFKNTIEQLVIRFEKYRGRTWRPFELSSLFLGVREEQVEIKQENLTSVQGDSSIYNFTNLRKVELFPFSSYYTDFGDIGFGEKAAISIFGRIEKLEYLYIDAYFCHFSDDGLESLKELGNSSSSEPFSWNVVHPIEKVFETEFDYNYDDEGFKNLLD